MGKHIAVGTHHKTGSAWMSGVFLRLAQLTGLRFVDLSRAKLGWNNMREYRALAGAAFRDVDDKGERGIFMDNHSLFSHLVGLPNVAGIHVIRDPRDVIVSAAKYHSHSDEPWLHVAQDEFDGLTYQQKINSIESTDDRMRFEMEHSSGQVIRGMGKFDGKVNFVDLKYEELMADVDLVRWHEASIHLDLHGEEILHSLTAFWERSLFGGLKRPTGEKSHVQDGRSEQWRRKMSPTILSECEERFGEVIAKLGYPLS